MYVTPMMKQLIILMLFAVLAFSQSIDSETFSSLDREVAGLMDAWVNITEDRGDESFGLFMAGTAILRAEAALEVAILSNGETLPAEVLDSWTAYLKSSADCINVFKESVGSTHTASSEEILLASFARWETRGGEFLESVQSTR